ncbi:hypothetical protein D3C85_1320440 [compost metagenome]
MFETGLTGAVKVFVIVVLRAADQLTLHQGFVAITLGAHHVQIGLGGGDLSAGGFQLQAHVLGIELGQRLVGLDSLPFVDQSSADFAADAERQVRFKAGTDFTRIAFGRLRRRLWLNHHGRANADLRRLFVTTRSQ